jgi:hypothetical protein
MSDKRQFTSLSTMQVKKGERQLLLKRRDKPSWQMNELLTYAYIIVRIIRNNADRMIESAKSGTKAFV